MQHTSNGRLAILHYHYITLVKNMAVKLNPIHKWDWVYITLLHRFPIFKKNINLKYLESIIALIKIFWGQNKVIFKPVSNMPSL